MILFFLIELIFFLFIIVCFYKIVSIINYYGNNCDFMRCVLIINKIKHVTKTVVKR